jgi:hypothetical protein
MAVTAGGQWLASDTELGAHTPGAGLPLAMQMPVTARACGPAK